MLSEIVYIRIVATEMKKINIPLYYIITKMEKLNICHISIKNICFKVVGIVKP